MYFLINIISLVRSYFWKCILEFQFWRFRYVPISSADKLGTSLWCVVSSENDSSGTKNCVDTLTIAFLVAGLYANFDVLDFRLLTSWRFTINNFPWTTGGRERCTICKSCQDRDCSSGRAGWPYLVRFCSDTDNFVHENVLSGSEELQNFPGWKSTVHNQSGFETFKFQPTRWSTMWPDC